MNLIIFDIDGTLTQTNKVDSRCFTQMIEEVLNYKGINTDWFSYPYSTDSGLLKEIYRYHLEREPSFEEIQAIQNKFLFYLKQAWLTNKLLYAPVTGIETILDKIKHLPHWHMAIATGGWKKSALFKLEAAAISHTDLPKAYADDHIERTEIIKIAI